MKHSLVTRVLHLLVAASIVLQLANSLLMRVPRPGRSWTDTDAAAFTLHEYAGLVSMAIIALFWLWMLVRRRETSLGLLFPWFSRQRLAALQEDILLHVEYAMRLTMPEPERSGAALSSAVQGVGLALALIVAATGTIGYFVWTVGTAMTGLAWVALWVHGTLANVVWGYLIVHVGAALLHELFGHRILYQMSPMPNAGGEIRSRPGRRSPMPAGSENSHRAWSLMSQRR
jgi:cytochrome b561